MEHFKPNRERNMDDARKDYPKNFSPLPEHNNHSQETLIDREDIDFKLLFQIHNELQNLQEKLDTLDPQNDFQQRELLQEQFDNNQIIIDTLLSKISPSKLEEFFNTTSKL